MLMVVSLSAVMFYSYQNTHKVVRSELQTRLEDVLALAARQMDGNTQHDVITTSDDIENEAYQTLWQQLNDIQSIISNIESIYTMRVVSDRAMVYVVGDNDLSGKDPLLPMTLVDFDSEQEAADYISIFRNEKEPWVEDDFYEDKWGVWLSGYAPFYREDGSLLGVLGMDIEAKQVRKLGSDYFRTFLSFLVPLLLVVILVSILLSRALSTSTKQLAVGMGMISQFDLSKVKISRSLIKEIQTMIDSMNVMRNGLHSFQKYVPYLLVRKLMLEKVEANPGGTRRYMTVFFSDIADFTTISEQIDATKLAEYLAEYFSVMTKVIEKNHGVVDKFIGDAVMAFWNAPEQTPNHELLACQAALGCQHEINALHEQWKEKHENIYFHTRIGIASGDVIVGNIGASNRLNYTVIGNAVNLASRLEGLNKAYSTDIIISSTVYLAVKDKMATRCLGEAAIKGIENPEKIYELIKKG